MKNYQGLKNPYPIHVVNTFLSRIRYQIMIFKTLCVFLLIGSIQLQAKSFSQQLSYKMKAAKIENAFKYIENKTDYVVLYDLRDVKHIKPVDINISNANISQFLSVLLKGLPYNFTIEDKTILINKVNKPVVKSVKLAEDVANNINIQQTLRGLVKSTDGTPLEGVSIIDLKTKQGTGTTASGSFELTISSFPTTIRFSQIGYAPVERQVTSASEPLNVALQAAVSDLDEVVVVGYGTQKKVNLTGAVAVVKSEQLTKQPVGQASTALQGAAPGLTVTQASGQPGRDMGSLRIRGIGTLGNSNPLVLIDGVEGNINNVNTNDIENISVLKDASSAAIYGSRAANGVILVTTKRAKNEGVTVDYNNYAGWQNPTEMTKMVNGLDHMNLLNEAYTNTGKSPIFTEQMIKDYVAGMESNPDRFPNTDWQGLTMKDNAFMQNHYIAAQGGSEKVKVLGSLGYFDQGGILENTKFRRYNFRLNSDLQISQKLSAAIDFFFTKSEMKEPAVGTNSVFHWMRRIPANQAGILSNGQYGEGWNGDNSIAKARDGGLNLVNPMNSVFNIDLKYKPIDGMTVNLVYSPKYEVSHDKQFINSIQTYYWNGDKAYLNPQRNSLTESYSQYWYNNLRAVVSYQKTLASDHNFNVMAGFQQEDQTDNTLSGYREIFLIPELQELNAGNQENNLARGTSSQWSLRSVFGRLNYDFKGKYLFEANARYDGSSRFAVGNKYSFFPSFSAGWRISQESFMQPLNDVVTEMKFRGSWGKLGNQNIGGLYSFASYFNIGANNYAFGENINTGAALSTMANPALRWESTDVSNIGLDLTLWRNLSITADYYHRKTSDILLQLDIAKILGYTYPPYQNAGVVENKGWDVSVAYNNAIGDFKYNVAVNLSDVKNKVLDMRGVMRTGLTVNHEGHPIGSLYGYQAIGYFTSAEDVANSPKQIGNIAAGDIKYQDQNGDGKIDAADEIIMGSPIPRYTYSANLGASYHGFDIALFFQGVAKADGYLFGQGIMPFYQGGTVQEQHKDRWTPENTNAAFPRYAFNENNNIQNSTFWMKNAAYLRLKNITIGYNVPLQSSASMPLRALRVFASGQNLFTKTNFWEGYDPEGPIGTGGWYPQMKVYSFGLSAKF
ncbi:SusC/RagA family TonB-linked outer membrane protein [Sphingobacterium sp. DK4209]|uniref:SusC/RagA family TonB-linked outer membrane protein n=1 Tax=Sphingobacterium zhuxiongii TaxID=2662364 RepID=A0A5Q0QDT3_9SPHI|nr:MULTISPECIES: TonB-dependent receptor [unclassified Sphingobacterium]MVZ64761.1 SusC/RagA family TonB-linked outer membrane protein [Sphingobacterium sp. DK4209]QGA27091.1 SusC/RagA family TonB-linked outer membrane protein [Sphingobacterium sp. dk4302]